MGKADTLDKRFVDSPWFDPDIVIYKQQWVKHYGSIIRQEAMLDNWLRISSITNLPLGKEYINMDEFWIEALSQTVNDYVKEQNDQQNKSMKDMESKLDTLKPQNSSFSGMSMPSFH